LTTHLNSVTAPLLASSGGYTKRFQLIAYAVLATLLHGLLIMLIIQRRDLSSLDQVVFVYLIVHLLVDGLRLLAAIVNLLLRGFPRLAVLGEGDWPPVTVVIPCHNEAEVIGETLRSLQAVEYPDLRLIVVDDGSTDATAAVAAAVGSGALILQQAQAGKAAALNAGIAAVNTPLTLLVDADCTFPRQSLRLAVRHLVGEAEDALGGHLGVLNQDNRITRLQQLEYGEIALRHFLWRFEFNLTHTQDVIPGALGLFRTSALRAAGPLPTTMLAEDVALTARLVELGYRLAFSPYLQGSTVVPDAVSALRIQRRRWVRGYTQVTLQQLGRLTRIPGRARLATLAMTFKIVRWPLDFMLALVYCLHAWSQGQPAVLLLSLLAMLFPFSLSGLSRFLSSDIRTLVVSTYGYGLMLLGWRLWDQLTLLNTPAPRWEPYRRRRASPVSYTASTGAAAVPDSSGKPRDSRSASQASAT
jgi:cellulose synthase/poly-beta-1,6-N-acetylglucosamine synthase-like glycosyltransferase